MKTEHDSIEGRMPGARARAAIALVLVAAGWTALNPGLPSFLAGRASAQISAQRTATDYTVQFEFTQSDKELGGSTDDQITVVFSTRSVDGPAPPVPFFGSDIVEEFSFSGRNFVNNTLRFSRRVRDKSFLDAPYIRVVNHGDDGWAGDRISLSVDGQVILRGVGMWPRRRALGQNTRGGIERFNPKDWALRSYWEASLQQYRGNIRK